MKKLLFVLSFLFLASTVSFADSSVQFFKKSQATRVVNYLNQHPEMLFYCGCYPDFQSSYVYALDVWMERYSLTYYEVWIYGFDVKTNEEIYKFAKKRDPFNHPTVMYRKSAVEAAGCYSDYRKNQDTDLWIKMLSNGVICMNLADPVFRFRFDESTYKKRKSWINTKILIEIRYKAWKSGFNSFGEFLVVATAQLGMYILPVGFQKFLYQKILRR